MTEMRAAGGTRAPLMLDWLMWLSMPKVNAEWEKPAEERKTFLVTLYPHVPAKYLTLPLAVHSGMALLGRYM